MQYAWTHAYVGFFETGISCNRVRIRFPLDWDIKFGIKTLESVGKLMVLRSLVLTHYQRVTDRQTDGHVACGCVALYSWARLKGLCMYVPFCIHLHTDWFESHCDMAYSTSCAPLLQCLMSAGPPLVGRWNEYQLSALVTRGQSNLTKSASRGPIPRLGVTPGGRNLYHWIPEVGFPISVP